VTGEDKIAHHVSPSGYYNGKKVVEEKEVEANETEDKKEVGAKE